MKQWIRDHAIGLTLLLVLSLMLMIFCFSAQPADKSDETSGYFVSLIVTLLSPDYESLDPDAKAALENRVSFLARKTAHFTEYTLLGFALMLHAAALQEKIRIPFPGSTAFIIGSLYSVSDELHQVFVPGRSGEGKDVLLDSAGVLLGVLLLRLLLHLRKKRLLP